MKSTLLFLSLVCSSAFARRQLNNAKHVAALKNHSGNDRPVVVKVDIVVNEGNADQDEDKDSVRTVPAVKSQHPPSVEKQVIPDDTKSTTPPSDPPALNDVPTIISTPSAVRAPVGPCSATGNAAGSTCVNNPTGTGSVYTGITSPKRI